MEPRIDQEATASTVRRFAANVTWMLVAQVAGKAASFVFIIIVARNLSVAEFGVFNFAISFVPLFLVFGGFGLESTVIRELARDRERLSERKPILDAHSVVRGHGRTLQAARGEQRRHQRRTPPDLCHVVGDGAVRLRPALPLRFQPFRR